MTARELAEKIDTGHSSFIATHIRNPETGLWDRVRKHQVQDHHKYYFDDETQEWYEVCDETAVSCDDGADLSRL